MRSIAEKLSQGALDELSLYFAPPLLIATAVKLGFFSAIAGGAKSLSRIASATKCSTRGVRMVLECLTAMGLLEKENGEYDLNRLSRGYFLASSPDYIGPLFLHSDKLLRLWLSLPEAVKTGRPTLSQFAQEEQEKLNRDIAEGLFQVYKALARRLPDLLAEAGFLSQGDNAIIKILDVGAGSAVWSLPFGLKYERAEITAVDFAPVLEMAKGYVQRYGVAGRYRFFGADVREADLGKGEYDLALLGHICHCAGAEGSRRLIDKCFRALKMGGKLLIMDYLPDEERRSAAFPLLLAVNALLGTEEGDTFTIAQYREWLLQSGFREVQTLPVNGHSPIIVALKG